MENERDPEIIRRQMEATRSHLTEKLEAIEEKVTSTVKETTDAVTDTVGEVKDAVQGTVEGVKEAVHDTVEGVKSAFDFKAHFQSHPWLMVLGAAGLSFVGTKVLMGRGRRRRDDDHDDWGERRGYTSAGSYQAAPAAASSTYATHTARSEPEGPGWMQKLVDSLGPSATKIKEMGIGMSMGLLDRLIGSALPDDMRGGVREMLDSMTTSLGGKPMHEWDSSGSNGAQSSGTSSHGTTSNPPKYGTGAAPGSVRDMVS